VGPGRMVPITLSGSVVAKMKQDVFRRLLDIFSRR
jgi:hypothetical protein